MKVTPPASLGHNEGHGVVLYPTKRLSPPAVRVLRSVLLHLCRREGTSRLNVVSMYAVRGTSIQDPAPPPGKKKEFCLEKRAG